MQKLLRISLAGMKDLQLSKLVPKICRPKGITDVVSPKHVLHCQEANPVLPNFLSDELTTALSLWMSDELMFLLAIR